MSAVYVRELSLKYRGPRRGASFEAASTPARAAEFLRRVLPDDVREHFLALFMDGRNQVTGYYVAATGTATSCPAETRNVFQAALVGGATAIIIAHNHTSAQNRDELFPSPEDLAVTHRFTAAGDLLGIAVLDHLIVGRSGHYSFQEHNRLRPRPGELPNAQTGAGALHA